MMNIMIFVLLGAVKACFCWREKYVYAIKKDSKNRKYADKRTVTLGKLQNGMVEILEGIKAGDAIIKEGAKLVRNEEQVIIKK